MECYNTAFLDGDEGLDTIEEIIKHITEDHEDVIGQVSNGKESMCHEDFCIWNTCTEQGNGNVEGFVNI